MPLKIISGGQTGVDRAALKVAIELGYPHGGWCPRGRKAEDGPIDAGYDLRETPSARYEQRTRWNVRDSDATVVFAVGQPLTGGTALTVRFAASQHKPCLVLTTDIPGETAAGTLLSFLADHTVATLNVAGPRGSQQPAAGDFARQVLAFALKRLRHA